MSMTIEKTETVGNEKFEVVRYDVGGQGQWFTYSVYRLVLIDGKWVELTSHDFDEGEGRRENAVNLWFALVDNAKDDL